MWATTTSWTYTLLLYDDDDDDDDDDDYDDDADDDNDDDDDDDNDDTKIFKCVPSFSLWEWQRSEEEMVEYFARHKHSRDHSHTVSCCSC